MNATDQLIASLLEGDDEDFFDTKELDKGNPYADLMVLLARGILDMYGVVKRHDHHYVHEKSTSFSLEATYNWPDDADPEITAIEQERTDALLNALEKDIDERMVDWNKKIYRELEKAYDWTMSDEVVEETINANQWKFDDNGGHDEDNGLLYAQLDNFAKINARKWYRDLEAENPDNYWSESVIAEWTWLLDKKGFTDIEINWSGFYSQGDGASFTGKIRDFESYFNFPDPLEFPEEDREQINESAEDEIDDMKDLTDLTHPYGYVLRLKNSTSQYPWLNTKSFSNRADCCGNFRRHIGDATVFHRLSTTKQWPDMEAVPIYSSPRLSGERALDSSYQPKPPKYFVRNGKLIKEQAADDDAIDPKDVENLDYSEHDIYLRYTYSDLSDTESEIVWDYQGPFSNVEGTREWLIDNNKDLAEGRWTKAEITVFDYTNNRQGRMTQRFDVDHEFNLHPIAIGVKESADDDLDIDTKDLAPEQAQRWTYRIFYWHDHKAINYYLIPPEARYLSSFDDTDNIIIKNPSAVGRSFQNTNAEFGIVRTGGHTFPKRTADTDLMLVAKAQIRQFLKAGFYDYTKWKNIWDWLKAVREKSLPEQPVPQP